MPRLSRLPWDSIALQSPPALMRCPPEWHWKPQPLLDYDFWFILKGKGTLRLGGRARALAAGTALLFIPGDQPVVSHDPGDPLHVFFVHFLPLPRSSSLRPLDFPDRNPRFLRRFAIASGWAHFVVTACEVPNPFAKRQAMLCVDLLLMEWWQENQSSPAQPVRGRLERLIQEIRANPGMDWNLGSMAGQVHLSVAQFSRLFRSLSGSSPVRFVIRARMDQACHLLKETGFTIAEVADALGYLDVFFFSHQFKKNLGRSPTLWRSLAQKQARGKVSGMAKRLRESRAGAAL